jgi:hypothetical protein
MNKVSGLVEEIGDGRLRAGSHEVARRLAEMEEGSAAVGAEILAAFDAGKTCSNALLLERLWAEIDDKPPAEQGALRTLVLLLHPDKPLDPVTAEYLIDWAQQGGLSPTAIEVAFRGG